jgi:ankyrin repeat protein
MTSCSILELPDEVILQIISNITTVVDLINLSKTCHRFRHLHNDAISNNQKRTLSFLPPALHSRQSTSFLTTIPSNEICPPRIRREILLRFLGTHKHVRSLDLMYNRIDSPFVMKRTGLANITYLNLSCCILDQSYVWLYILMQMRNLRVLDLSRCYSVTHGMVSEFLINRPKALEEVILTDLHIPRSCLRLLNIDTSDDENLEASTTPAIDPIDMRSLEFDLTTFVRLTNSTFELSELSSPHKTLLTLNNMVYLHTLGLDLNCFLANGMETILSAACELGRSDVVEYLLKQGCDTEKVNPKTPRPPLVSWAKSGCTKTLEVLFKYGVNRHQVDHNGYSVLHKVTLNAPYFQRIAMIKELLRYQLDINTISTGKKSGRSPLDCAFIAIEMECTVEEKNVCVDVIRLLIEMGAVIRQPMHYLRVCCQINQVTLADFLFQNGVTLEGQNDFFLDMLSTASEDMLLLLLRNGANANVVSWNGISAISFAAGRGFQKLVQYLLDVNVDPNEETQVVTWQRHCPLSKACDQGHIPTIKLLVEYGARMSGEDMRALLHYIGFNIPVAAFIELLRILKEAQYDFTQPLNDKLETLMHYAVQMKFSSPIVEFLVHNTSACPLDENDNSPLHLYLGKWAHNKNQVDMKVGPLLLEFTPPAIINKLNSDGFNCLHFACRHFSVEIVKSIISNGGDPNIPTSEGTYPIHFAVHRQDWFMLKYLVLNSADPTIADSKGIKPIQLMLSFPIMFSHALQDRELHSLFQDPNAPDNTGKTLLHHLARSGDMPVVKLFVNQFRDKIDFRAEDNAGFSAAQVSTTSDIRALLLKEEERWCARKINDIENLPSAGWLTSPIDAFSNNRPVDVTTFHDLLQRFGLDWVDNDGNHFFHYLLSDRCPIHTQSNNLLYYRHLWTHFKPQFATIPNSEGYFPLHLAVQSKCLYVLNQLVQKLQVDPNQTTLYNRYSVFHVCVLRHGVDKAIFRFLMSIAANYNAQDANGRTVWHVVARDYCESDSILRLCNLDMTPNLYQGDKDGKTVVHYLVAHLTNAIPVVETFFQKYGMEINFNLKDQEGHTVLDMCRSRDMRKLVEKYNKVRARVLAIRNDSTSRTFTYTPPASNIISPQVQPTYGANWPSAPDAAVTYTAPVLHPGVEHEWQWEQSDFHEIGRNQTQDTRHVTSQEPTGEEPSGIPIATQSKEHHSSSGVSYGVTYKESGSDLASWGINTKVTENGGILSGLSTDQTSATELCGWAAPMHSEDDKVIPDSWIKTCPSSNDGWEDAKCHQSDSHFGQDTVPDSWKKTRSSCSYGEMTKDDSWGSSSNNEWKDAKSHQFTSQVGQDTIPDSWIKSRSSFMDGDISMSKSSSWGSISNNEMQVSKSRQLSSQVEQDTVPDSWTKPRSSHTGGDILMSNGSHSRGSSSINEWKDAKSVLSSTFIPSSDQWNIHDTVPDSWKNARSGCSEFEFVIPKSHSRGISSNNIWEDAKRLLSSTSISPGDQVNTLDRQETIEQIAGELEECSITGTSSETKKKSTISTSIPHLDATDAKATTSHNGWNKENQNNLAVTLRDWLIPSPSTQDQDGWGITSAHQSPPSCYGRVSPITEASWGCASRQRWGKLSVLENIPVAAQHSAELASQSMNSTVVEVGHDATSGEQSASHTGQDHTQRSPLHILENDLLEVTLPLNDILTLLDKIPNDLNSTSEAGLTALHVACAKGHTKWAIALLRKGADAAALCTRNGFTPFLCYVSHNGLCSDFTNSYLKECAAALCHRTSLGIPVLHHIIRNNKMVRVQLWLTALKSVPYPNTRDSADATPLHVVCEEYAIQELLGVFDTYLKLGANPVLVDANGDSPAHIVVRRFGFTKKTAQIVQKCVGAGFEISSRNGDEQTIFHVGLSRYLPEQITICTWVSELGSGDLSRSILNSQDIHGKVLLHYLAQHRPQEDVVLFCKSFRRCLKFDVRDKQNRLPSSYAFQARQQHVFNFLCKLETGTHRWFTETPGEGITQNRLCAWGALPKHQKITPEVPAQPRRNYKHTLDTRTTDQLTHTKAGSSIDSSPRPSPTEIPARSSHFSNVPITPKQALASSSWCADEASHSWDHNNKATNRWQVFSRSSAESPSSPYGPAKLGSVWRQKFATMQSNNNL